MKASTLNYHLFKIAISTKDKGDINVETFAYDYKSSIEVRFSKNKYSDAIWIEFRIDDILKDVEFGEVTIIKKDPNVWNGRYKLTVEEALDLIKNRDTVISEEIYCLGCEGKRG